MSGDSFRLVICDARKPDEVHHEKRLDSDSKLMQHIRDDFQEVLEGAEYWETDHMTGALPGTGTLIVTLDEVGIEMLEGRSGIDLINVQVLPRMSQGYIQGILYWKLMINLAQTFI